jgi:hypothetical protein
MFRPLKAHHQEDSCNNVYPHIGDAPYTLHVDIRVYYTIMPIMPVFLMMSI